MDIKKLKKLIKEMHYKVNPSTSGKSHLAGKALQIRNNVRAKLSNQRMSKRYTAEEEKPLGKTDTGKAGETIDTTPVKKELTGQLR